MQLGLIERTEDPEDRRAKRLALTQKGRTLIEQGIEARSKWIEGVTDALTPEQQKMIISRPHSAHLRLRKRRPSSSLNLAQ